MGKRTIPYTEPRKKGQKPIKKDMSHSTFTAKRHPNSKRVTSGAIK